MIDFLWVFRQKNFFSLLLIVLATALWAIEGWEVSNVDVAFLTVAAVYLVFNVRYLFSRAMMLGMLYWLVCYICASYHPATFRWSTLIYLALFILGFISYYGAVYTNHISIGRLIGVFRFLLFAYFATLLIQQVFMFAGGQGVKFGLINYGGIPDKPNMLALEVSHAARLLTVFMLGLIRLYQVQQGNRKLTLKELFRKDKWAVVVYLYCMLVMGSGTAFIALPLLFTYFLNRRGILIFVPLIVAVYVALPHINYEPVQRASAVIEATLTGKNDEVIETDGSAASRVVPLLNVLKLDFLSADTWLGKGIDARNNSDLFSDEQVIGGITDYGLLSYILSLIFIFSCCIRRMWSLETLLLLFLFGAGIGNVSYIWVALMIFATIRFFQIKSEKTSVSV